MTIKISKICKVHKHIESCKSNMSCIKACLFTQGTFICVKEIKCWCVVLLQLRCQTFLWWAQVGCSMEIYGTCRCIGMVLQGLSTASKSYLDHTMSQVEFLIVVCRLHCSLGIMSRGNKSCAQATVATKFCMVASNICGSVVWNLSDFTLLSLRILRWLLNFWKIFASLIMRMYEIHKYSISISKIQ